MVTYSDKALLVFDLLLSESPSLALFLSLYGYAIPSSFTRGGSARCVYRESDRRLDLPETIATLPLPRGGTKETREGISAKPEESARFFLQRIYN